MEILSVTITAEAPLVFSERRPDGQFRPSARYITGSVLRGALAQQMRDAGELADFATLFTAPNAPLFRNAYPGKGIVPATAISCKAEPGFGRHGVYDTLLDRLCAEQMESELPYLPRCPHKDHGPQGERVEPFTGFYTHHQGIPVKVEPAARLVTRVALNRRRQVAEPNLLYSPFAISEQTHQQATAFQGSVVVDDSNRDAVRRRLPTLTHVGSGASRGFGKVQVEIGPWQETPVGKRVEDFQQALEARRQLWEQLPHHCPFPEGFYFSVLLLSDAVLRVGGWTPTFRLEPAFLGNLGAPAKLVHSYAHADFRGGWNTAWELPKDVDLIARMGSVYVYRLEPAPDSAAWQNAFARLESVGVGERRQEGFGQVRICDPFHIDQLICRNEETRTVTQEKMP